MPINLRIQALKHYACRPDVYLNGYIIYRSASAYGRGKRLGVYLKRYFILIASNKSQLASTCSHRSHIAYI